jgi:V/A-type H+-transporting ATPase subunit E
MIQKAEREAQALIDKATADSQQEQQSKLAEAKARAVRSRALILATLPVDIGRMRSIRVERELLTLRDQVGQALEDRAGFDYEQTLVHLAAEALTRMEGDDFVLELSARDLATTGQTLRAAVQKQVGRPNITLTVSSEPADIANGVIIRDRVGRQVWDNSLQARLNRLWPELRNQLAEALGLVNDAADSGGQS